MSGNVLIKQGDLFWIDLGETEGSEPAYKHPHVVIQNNLFNSSRINTVIVCAITSNLKRATAPGNVLLKATEANLLKDSVVLVSQLFTVDKTYLDDYIGTLSSKRVNQIIEGIKLLLDPRDPDKD
jgi:mRNA interferase MazF